MKVRIEAGQNIKYIQNQLGYSSIQVTMKKSTDRNLVSACFIWHAWRDSNPRPTD